MTGAWAYVQAKSRWTEAELRRGALIAAPLALLVYGFLAWEFGRFALTEPGNIGPYARAETFQTLLHTALRAALMGYRDPGPVWMQRPFVNRLTSKLAELSYGIYLIHLVLIIYAAASRHAPRRHLRRARRLGGPDPPAIASSTPRVAALSSSCRCWRRFKRRRPNRSGRSPHRRATQARRSQPAAGASTGCIPF